MLSITINHYSKISMYNSYLNEFPTKLLEISEIEDARKLANWTMRHYTPYAPSSVNTNQCHVLITGYHLDEEYCQGWFCYPIFLYKNPQPMGLGKSVNAVSIVLNAMNINENIMTTIINTCGVDTRSLFLKPYSMTSGAIEMLAKFLVSDKCQLWFLRIWIADHMNNYKNAKMLTPIYRAWRHNKTLKGLELPNYRIEEDNKIDVQKSTLSYLKMLGPNDPVLFFSRLRHDKFLKYLYLEAGNDYKENGKYYFDFLKENTCLETYDLLLVSRTLNIEHLTECLKDNRCLRHLKIELCYEHDKITDAFKERLYNMMDTLREHNQILKDFQICVDDTVFQR